MTLEKVDVSKGQRDAIARARQWAYQGERRMQDKVARETGVASLEREIRSYAARLPHRLTRIVETLFDVGSSPEHPKCIEAARVLLDRLDGPVKVSVEHAFESAREGIVLHVTGSPQRALPASSPLAPSVLASPGVPPSTLAQSPSEPSLAQNAAQSVSGPEGSREGIPTGSRDKEGAEGREGE